ncbi:MAG: peptidylprolyl isomerase, partial [Clostridiales Family XIII bacterium]|nr:peptidylprolyl isomerase [Clostridiales Family XIII bacterium]
EDGGVIVLELDPDVAPVTTENFLKLVNANFYDGLTFHRVIKGFMIQGGDPLGNGTGGSDDKIEGEFSSNGHSNSISHVRGVISMARSANKNSASSQFFITNEDATFLDGDYASFGHVVSGMDVVDRISDVKTDTNDKPLEPVVIQSIRQV